MAFSISSRSLIITISLTVNDYCYRDCWSFHLGKSNKLNIKTNEQPNSSYYFSFSPILLYSDYSLELELGNTIQTNYMITLKGILSRKYRAAGPTRKGVYER